MISSQPPKGVTKTVFGSPLGAGGLSQINFSIIANIQALR